ncbi:hypothetical protein B566_EDAN019477 [Ephemera danica]|nr:hypothetical protein B566_EDAN019477 [Ephemera danica]
MRAIPWGFSWGQCRLTLPGWYGFGSAVQAFLQAQGETGRAGQVALLQKMCEQWPFFSTLLSNMDMVLAKSDLALARRYAELVPDKKLRSKVFGAIETEWQRTADALTLITGAKQRLANNAALQRSIRHRFPYIDPLHHLQVELVRRYRAGENHADTDEKKVTFYRQSDIPEIPELTWLLTCVTGKGLLNRAHAYKASVDKNMVASQEPDAGVTAGLYMYPVLMAADILMFNAHQVPVGRDQIQHIEMARDIASSFNHLYGEHFTLPEAVIEAHIGKQLPYIHMLQAHLVIARIDAREVKQRVKQLIDCPGGLQDAR